MKRLVPVLAAAAGTLFAGGFLFGCTPSATDNNAATTTPANGASPAATGDGKKVRIAFVTNNASDFWTIARKGVEKAQSENPNIEMQFLIPSDGSASEQKRLVDDALVKGLDGMAISPVAPADQTQMLNDVAKQAVLVTQDSDAPESDRACYVGTDNVAAGKQAAELIKEALPNGGKIMLFVGKIDAQNALERQQGIKEGLAGSNVTILDTRTDDADRTKAKSNVSDTLVKYPDIAGLVGLWSYNGPAILNAAREAGKTGKVKIVCFDEEDETLAGVKSGDIFGTVVQQPYEFGYQSVTMIAKAVGGDKSIFPADKKKIVPTLAIKKAEVDDFQTKLNGLRGRTDPSPAAK